MQKCASVYYKSEQHYSNGALAATRHCDLVASGGCGAHREETMDTADQNQFELNEDQLAIQDMARGFASDFVAPHALRWDRDKHFPIDVIKETGPLGMGGIYVREDALMRSLFSRRLPRLAQLFQRLFPSTIWQHG
jgi:alkylation response protein AidB-like acyl-CoA dehydrogenase